MAGALGLLMTAFAAGAAGQGQQSPESALGPGYREAFAVEARERIAELEHLRAREGQSAVAGSLAGSLAEPLKVLEDYYHWAHTAHLAARDVVVDAEELVEEAAGAAPSPRRMFQFERLVGDFRFQWTGALHAAASFRRQVTFACFTGEAFDSSCVERFAGMAEVFARHEEHFRSLGEQVDASVRTTRRLDRKDLLSTTSR